MNTDRKDYLVQFSASRIKAGNDLISILTHLASVIECETLLEIAVDCDTQADIEREGSNIHAAAALEQFAKNLNTKAKEML